MKQVLCPDCEDGDVVFFGSIPASSWFAGRTVSPPLTGGGLYRCNRCRLGFRWPQLGKERLDELYTLGSEDNWGDAADVRTDWSIAQCWLRSLAPSGTSVLDVGCFDGRFLNSLGAEYLKYGIEIHPAAQKMAAARGVSILGNDVRSLSAFVDEFDFVTAFDVIEHVAQPKEFLVQCAHAAKPGGYVLIATGNLDAPTFRLMGSKYYYCHVAEHISFVSPEWCRKLAEEFKLNIVQLATFCHGRKGLKAFVDGAVRSLFYKGFPRAFANLRRRGWGEVDASEYPELGATPPGWGGASDHFIILLRKT